MRIVILGASGSIGQQTLDVIKLFPNDYELVGVSVGTRVEEVDKISSSFSSVKNACVKNHDDVSKVHSLVIDNVFDGSQGLLDLINISQPDLVVNALVGFAGLQPTLYCIEHDIDVALANKESIVVGGQLINDLLPHHRAKIYPIDSEHVAISKCLNNKSEVKRLVLTASGGAFRDLSLQQLEHVKAEDALKHPSWNMGSKITIDCATMMNKGFEIIEAHYLFNVSLDRITILMHDESKIHSLVEYKDGSFLADIGPTDMRIPISDALSKGSTKDLPYSLDLEQLGSFHFRPFDKEKYPCVEYARLALEKGGTLPCVINAANEVAVNEFLMGNLRFLDIHRIIKKCMDDMEYIEYPTFDDLLNIDDSTRQYAYKIIKEGL